MDDVAKGDVLLTDRGFARFVGWLHQDTKLRGDFLEIVYANGATNNTLTVTGNHHVRLASSVFVEAQDIDIGSWLMGADGSPKQVVEIRVANSRGVYAPLTTTGTVTVEGIQCSNYAEGPMFEIVMRGFTWPWRHGWLTIPEGTDLYTRIWPLPKYYLKVVGFLLLKSSV